MTNVQSNRDLTRTQKKRAHRSEPAYVLALDRPLNNQGLQRSAMIGNFLHAVLRVSLFEREVS